jgi:hypothetical protein
MNILVFKTNIRTKKMVKSLTPLFHNYPIIAEWSVDTEDIDNVLRIATIGNLSETDVIHMVKDLGLNCEALTD